MGFQKNKDLIKSHPRKINFLCLYLLGIVSLFTLNSVPRLYAHEVVIPFSELHKKLSALGTKPRNVWTYGKFTAWEEVQDGVFAASFPKLLSYGIFQKLSAFTVSPTEVIVQIAVCETDIPIPAIKQGTRFEITRTEPAEVLEMIQSNSFYARLRLSASPLILSIPKAEKVKNKKGKPQEQRTLAHEQQFEESSGSGQANDEPLVVHFSDIEKALKKRGPHPQNTWTYGRFSVDSPLQEGLFIAHEAGLATRRIVEGVISAGIIFPFGERYDSAIFISEIPRLKIPKKSVIEISKNQPAAVVEIVQASGLIVRIELDHKPKIEKEGSSDGAKDFFSPLIRAFSP
ncbi:hypothetical protein [Candidatus Methylacidiphilum infernorum]|uniref:Uncharacterized protein n=1 Tax=Methylacidiphilum infernorum (isolate V4) TaxID=481448 RepID=B3DVL8_METI4|nr:hypothetical protein [Candidatus Methylacidiphilum infernorum]ACD83371.1 Hypothetical protein Minf_1317 [Methylacidiphilum infernorum V4]